MSKITVVLVEDHDLTRVGLLAALQQVEKIEVVGKANNGLEGLQTIVEKSPNVAIISLNLEGIDGIEMTQRLKKDPKTASTKILILTTRTKEQDVLAAFVAGADSYLLKDVDFNQLVEVIFMTYEGNSWIDPAIADIVLKQIKTPVNSHVTVPSLSENNGLSSSVDHKTCIDSKNQELVETSPLTNRELDVLELIVGGCNNAQIAEKLCITVGTVKTHVRNILNKLCVDDRTQAAVCALRSGLID